MDFFFAPRSIAVIGASPKSGKIGNVILRSLLDSSYSGEVYPVNPKESEIMGLPCHASVKEVRAEMAVISLPAHIVPGVVRECGESGVRGIVIISGGFKEMGPDGKRMEEEIVSTAKEYGMRIIGPNCIGVYAPKNGIDLLFQPDYAMVRPGRGNIAVLSQSGTYAATLLEWIRMEGFGVSKMVSFGNKADVDEVDLIEYLAADPETDVIALYLESTRREFLPVLREVTKKKPVVILKGGQGSMGSKAAMSHTGALAGKYEVFRGVIKQHGGIVAEDIEEMLDIIKILSLTAPPPGNRALMITNGAGPAVSALDFMEKGGKIVPAVVGDETKKALAGVLPSYCIFKNPIDLTGSASGEMYVKAMRAAANTGDFIIMLFVFQDGILADTYGELLDRIPELMRKTGKAVIGISSGGPFTEERMKEFQAAGVPMLRTPKRAVKAMEKVIEYGRFLSRKN